MTEMTFHTYFQTI